MTWQHLNSLGVALQLRDRPVLNSSDPKLTEVVMGVGNFSSQGDGRTGQILVPSARLGAVGSPQRIAIRDAVAGLTANGYTPSAHAYAEAAAYLMGTVTAGATNPVVVSEPHTTTTTSTTYPILKREKYKTTTSTTTINTPVGCSGKGKKKCTGTSTVTTTNNSKCDQNKSSPDFTTGIWECRGSQWSAYTGTIPTPSTPASTVVDGVIDGSYSGGTGVTIYYMNDNSQPLVSSVDTTTNTTVTNYTLDNTDSGFNQSVASSKDLSVPATPHYLSPLPAVANRATCDGQGIYFLSDGQPNHGGSNNDDTKTIMGAALKTTFTCPTSGGLTDTDDGNGKSGWKCMGAFAQTLYNKDTNPSGVSIKTAFVGFGADFAGLASTDVLNACHLGSNPTGDTCSPDSTSTSNRNPTGGYGNGGFYIAATADSVTDSVVNFINNLGNDAIHPLVTGAATIPIDDLNPNGFQPYGYLRMLEPNPAKSTVLLWRGDVKKYALSGGALVSKGSTSTTVLNASGALVDSTTDLWNASTGDGGKIDQGGAYTKVLMPTTASPNTIRPLFTDVGSVQTDGTLNAIANGANLTAVTADAPLSTNIPALFDGTTGTAPLKDISLTQKLKLINYLGFDVPLDSTSVPTTLTAPASAFLAMGGSIHAQPIQLSYSSTLKADGTLSNTLDANGIVIGRTESVLYGSMEGALHLVNASTGVEQMAFVPKEILENDNSSAALRVGAQDMSAIPQTPAQGVDGPWVADTAYKVSKGATVAASKLVASRMNVYGGLRMGGTSYYGLDLLNLTGDTLTPKLLFRIGPDISDYSQMGQSWSKPVLANVRYNNVITRVMLIGGGYDVGYENPSFIPSGSAAGNTVYMVNATTGALIWHATTTDNANLIHSIPGRVSAIDRDADGLIDSIYFADLGGQVFRADFNNKYDTSTSKFGVRVTRLADLATSTEKTNGTNPRFYEAPTVTIHDQGTKTFALITVASGNRSSPLDVIDVSLGGKGLRNLPVNNVYGIIDRDVARPDLIKLNTAGTTYVNTNGVNAYAAVTHDLTLSDLQKDPQANLSGVIANAFFPTDTTTPKEGWYRSLSSTSAGVEKANGTYRYPGGFKAFEEKFAITGKLYVPVYDPQGTGVAAGDPCDPRVVGETDLQTFCLPYGVCLVETGTNAGQKDTSVESLSGARFTSDTTPKNDKVLGGGIRGIALGDNGTTPSATDGDCKGFTIIGNTSGLGNWNCKRKLVPTLWYEKQPNRSKVQ
jgi:type IV pilus assembly protein PilY1